MNCWFHPNTAICLSLLVFAIGCHADSTPDQQSAARQIEAQLHQDEAARINAMKPMRGLWSSDLDATLAENSALAAQVLGAIRADLESYPIDLKITDQDYISRTRMKTIRDKYLVQYVDGGTVHLQLTGAAGDQPGRQVIVHVRDGHLIIENASPFRAVFSRMAGAATTGPASNPGP